MMNDHEVPGWICPSCGNEEVCIVALVRVRVTADGAEPDPNDSNYEWGDDADAVCRACEWNGTANDAATAAQAKYPQLTE